MISTWVKNNIFTTITMFLKQGDFTSEVQQFACLQHFVISLHLSLKALPSFRMVQFFSIKTAIFIFKKIYQKRKQVLPCLICCCCLFAHCYLILTKYFVTILLYVFQ